MAGGNNDRVGVGAAAVVIRDGHLLLVRRRFHGAGTWSTPGGYLDPGESPEDAAVRETAEETGLATVDPVVVGISNDIHPDGKHNVTFWVTAAPAPGTDAGDARLIDADETLAVGWFPLDALPAPIYLSLERYLDGATYAVVGSGAPPPWHRRDRAG
ncbi:MAG: NUDIX hydrolase [Thermomicrobiales bacterium]